MTGQPLDEAAPRTHTRSLTETEVHQALVRQFAADPVQQRWLRAHVAAHVEREAQALEGGAQKRLLRWAKEHRSGATGLW